MLWHAPRYNLSRPIDISFESSLHLWEPWLASFERKRNVMKLLALLHLLLANICSLFAQIKPPVLMPGLGQHHHTISTKNHDAQLFFDQGLTLVFAFNHEEAARAFRRASELDPQSAMAFWGIALALGRTRGAAQATTN